MGIFKGFPGFLSPRKDLNIQMEPIRVNRICEKFGGFVAGNKGRNAGKWIDDRTSDVTIQW